MANEKQAEYTLKIVLENDAFKGGNAGPEIARILRETADKVTLFSFMHEKSFYPLRDVNGNKVGEHGYRLNAYVRP